MARSRTARKALLKVSHSLGVESLESRLMFCLQDMLSWQGMQQLGPLGNTIRAAIESGTPDSGPELPMTAPSGSFTTAASGMPILNSLPGAPDALYLNFAGGPVWGGASAGGVDEPAFNLDGDPTTFNSDEQGHIYYMWRQVSMFYSMFNLNVTTVDPGSIPHAWNDVGPYNGGLDNVGSFPDTSAAGISSDWIGFSSGVAHESGHDFGNGHTSSYDSFGNKTEEYRTTTAPLRGAIMGGRDGVINKWTNWLDTYSADNIQDDMKVISSAIVNATGVGDGYRTDDFGGTIATATALNVSSNSQTITGNIERLTDADAFSFNSGGGTYNIMVGRDSTSGVDVKIAVYDASGNLVAQDDGDPRTVPYTMVNDSHLSLDLAAGKYYLIVQSHGNYDDQGQYLVRVDQGNSGWTASDVGLNAMPGYSNYDSASSTYSVTGSGHDIWGNADGAQYYYQTLTGNGTVTAKVTGISDVSPWAQAGVMIRSSISGDAQEFSMMMSAEKGPEMSYRTTSGGVTAGVDLKKNVAFVPTWVRITRSGNSFFAFTSTDGLSWSFYGLQTIIMPTTVQIGLVSSSVDDATQDSVVNNLNTATFSNVGVSGNLNAPPTLNSWNAPGNLTINSPTSISTSLSWTGPTVPGDMNNDSLVDSNDFTMLASQFGGGAGAADLNHDGTVNALDFNMLATDYGMTSPSFSVERSTDGVHFSQVAIAPRLSTNYVDAVADDQKYYYRVRSLDGTTVSAPSSVLSVTTRAGAVSNLNIIRETPTEVVVDWTDASGETGYTVQRSTDGATGWTTVGSPGQNSQALVDSGQAAGQQYFYRVLTKDAAGTAATSTLVDSMGLTFTTKTATQMAIQWSAITGATGYKVERSTDDTTWTTLAANQTGTTYSDTAVTPLTKYYYHVTPLGTLYVTAPGSVFAASPAAAPNLPTTPSVWSSADIGSGIGGTGAAAYSAGTFTMLASGGDIWNTADQFRYTYMTLPGAGWIQTRVASLDAATSPYAKAAVMIRSTTNAGSKDAFMEITPSGAYFQYRQNTNGNCGSVGPATATAPIWLRIERTISGSTSTITGKTSTDGVTWTTIGTTTLSNTSGSVTMGLALTAQNNMQLNKSTFDNVTVNAGGVTTALT